MKRRIGAISDIHGDAAALRVALEWLDAQGVSDVVCAGDIAGFGPYPNQCISMLVERGIRTVMGNHDYSLHRLSSTAPVSRRLSEIAEIHAWSRGQLSRESLTYLRNLPQSLALEGGGLVVHGAPGDMTQIVGPEDVPPIPSGIKVVLAGHLHVPFVIQSRAGLWVNVGSACRPCDGDPRLAVSIFTESRGEWTVSQHRIDFDPRLSARDILASGMPFAENVASAVLESRWY
ncbi:MAG: metallophosphoesterase family protein [Bacillota bacterium]